MNRRERLMRTLRGESVDRPPVCFYEINGYDEHPEDANPYNIYSHPSWLPLIRLARDYSDRILLRYAPFIGAAPDPLAELTTLETYEQGDSLFTLKTIKIGRHTLTERSRRDRDVNTLWILEHLFKDSVDVQAFLSVPPPAFCGVPDPTSVLQAEAALGDSGIVMLDTADPLCQAAYLFSMADYTVFALTEPALFHRLLEYFSATLLPQTQAIASALPGRLWRIYGPEYASPPYLPPHLFAEYVVPYVTPMVSAIQSQGGFARIHCHGRLKLILDHIAATGCSGLDPIEPPPQGDVTLEYVRQRYGEQMVLFGNLEASDIETLPTPLFAQKIAVALQQGTQGKGRGFVLMASACPYGRVLSPLALANYEKMIAMVA